MESEKPFISCLMVCIFYNHYHCNFLFENMQLFQQEIRSEYYHRRNCFGTIQVLAISYECLVNIQLQDICYSTLSSDYKPLFSKRLLFKFNLQYLHSFWRNYDVSLSFISYYKKLHVCMSDSPSVPILRPLHVTDGKLGLTLSNM